MNLYWKRIFHAIEFGKSATWKEKFAYYGFSNFLQRMLYWLQKFYISALLVKKISGPNSNASSKLFFFLLGVKFKLPLEQVCQLSLRNFYSLFPMLSMYHCVNIEFYLVICCIHVLLNRFPFLLNILSFLHILPH